MIAGRFGENGQIYFEIDLITRDGLNFSTEAMLDNGFTELLAISQQDLESLDWTFISQDKLRTTQRGATFDIYLGKLGSQINNLNFLYLQEMKLGKTY